jgi:hypothetical protein
MVAASGDAMSSVMPAPVVPMLDADGDLGTRNRADIGALKSALHSDVKGV